MDDAELMARLQADEPAALAGLMERWEVPVKRLIARLVQNTAEADDLAQETFTRVWQQRQKFRPGAEFRPWVFAIAVNQARNRLRWWRRRPTVSLEEWHDTHEVGRPANGGVAGTSAIATDDGGGRNAAERNERVEAVRAAIADLPHDLRAAVVLFEYEHLSHAEIAAAVGCTAKAVETRLYRARALLKKSLARALSA